MRADSLFFSDTSGDLIADKRFAYAMACMQAADWPAAADLFAQTLELVPHWPSAHFALGEVLCQLGRIVEASQAFRSALRLDPVDRLGAGPRLAALGLAPVPDQLPQAYVRTLFDQYAERFDAELVEALHYSAPWRLRDLLLNHLPGQHAARLLDLGCGTGLMGEAMRKHASWLVGVDLSAEMAAMAARKKVYDEVGAGEAIAILAETDCSYDAITAADVLVYMGDLHTLLAAVAGKLVPGGYFAFSCERFSGEGFVLGAGLRYAHSRSYIQSCLTGAGLELAEIAEESCRQESGQDVMAYFVVARKAPHIDLGPKPDGQHVPAPIHPTLQALSVDPVQTVSEQALDSKSQNLSAGEHS